MKNNIKKIISILKDWIDNQKRLYYDNIKDEEKRCKRWKEYDEHNMIIMWIELAIQWIEDSYDNKK